MKLDEKEGRDGITWLVCAGLAAVTLGLTLWFIVDDRIMGSASARDRAHAAQLRELRTAQTSLGSRVTDERQTVNLTMEHVAAEQGAKGTAADHAGQDHATQEHGAH